jgi:hypothetical protein
MSYILPEAFNVRKETLPRIEFPQDVQDIVGVEWLVGSPDAGSAS